MGLQSFLVAGHLPFCVLLDNWGRGADCPKLLARPSNHPLTPSPIWNRPGSRVRVTMAG
jgi:hypothetical protein